MESCAQIASEGFRSIAEDLFYLLCWVCRAGGKVTIPLLVREVLKIEEGDYVRLNISQIIKKKQQQQKERGRKRERVRQVLGDLFLRT